MIPLGRHDAAEQELNRFLNASRVLTVHREFVTAGENSYWAFAVEYLPGPTDTGQQPSTPKTKVDYREVLSEADFALFARLRQWRKEAAGREAVPVYTVFTNEQLAEIARKHLNTLNGLHELEGVGDAKVQKFGREIIAIVNEQPRNETEGQPLSPDR